MPTSPVPSAWLPYLLAALGPTMAHAQEAPQPHTPYPLGPHKHLFIDNFLIAEKTNVTLTVNPPQRKELVLIADQPWERGGITSYANVFWDPDFQEYRLYYVPVNLDSDPIFRLALATSKDGLHWEKPHLGVVEWQGSKENNVVIDGQREGTVMIDPHGEPEKRYVFLSSHPELRTRLFTSPDGIHWTMEGKEGTEGGRGDGREGEGGKKPISDHHSDSQISTFWDDQLQKYVHYPRVEHRGRATGRVETSRMDEAWPAEIPVVLSADDEDPAGMDLYTNSAQKYALAPNVYLAFPTPYYHYDHPGREYLNLPALRLGGTGNDGVIETQLAVSRDGKVWTRYRTPYVPLYRHEDLDLKIVMVFPGLLYHEGQGTRDEGRGTRDATPEIRNPSGESANNANRREFLTLIRKNSRRLADQNPKSEIRNPKSVPYPHIDQYFGGYTFTHGDRQARRRLENRALGGIFRLEQRIDGFVSADFAYTGGSLTTALFVFAGNCLTLNVNTSAAGEGRVAILDADGQPVAGYALEDGDFINGDYLDKPVSWRGKADVSALAGQPVRLRFDLRGAKLYAFQFSQRDLSALELPVRREAVQIHDPLNVAPQAQVTTSSAHHGGFAGEKAVDGIVPGYTPPMGEEQHEWAADGQKEGAWLRLDWAESVTVDTVILYDRPNRVDHVLAGTLTFSDGTSVAVPELPPSGETGAEVKFEPKRISWLRFTVDQVSESCSNAGLAEIIVRSVE